MTEIRASVTVDVHRKLKEEAARSGKHLKELVAEVLQVHVKNGKVESHGKAVKR
jgi:hypothetical protein